MTEQYRPENPQYGHEGKTGVTEPVECANCHEVVQLTVFSGKVRCPACKMVEEATGLKPAVTWDE